MKIKFILNCCMAFSLASVLLAESADTGDGNRTWTLEKTKKTVEGEAIKFDGKKVTIKTAKKTATLPVATLSQEDQDWLKEHADDLSSKAKDSDSKDATSEEVGSLAKEIQGLTSVLEKGEFNLQKPKLTAKYYLILSSASWCGPCQAEMPGIVKEYKRIKNNPSIELIHVSADRNVADALKWAKEVKAPFPIIIPNTPNIPKALTQNSSGGIPNMVILNSEGKVIAEGHPQTLMQDYKKIITKDNGGPLPK